MRRYWINTEGKQIAKITLTSSKIEDVMPANARLLLKLQECSLWEYFVYDMLRINLKAKKGDRYKWLKYFIKTKVAYFILAIASGLSKVSRKTR